MASPGTKGTAAVPPTSRAGTFALEVLIHGDGLERLWSVLEADYFDLYAVVAWSHPVRVRRVGKFGDL